MSKKWPDYRDRLRSFRFQTDGTSPSFLAIDTNGTWNGFAVVVVPASEREKLLAAFDHGVRDWERRLLHADGTIIDPSGGAPLPLVTVDGVCDEHGNAVGCYDLDGYAVEAVEDTTDPPPDPLYRFDVCIDGPQLGNPVGALSEHLVDLFTDLAHLLIRDADQSPDDAIGLLQNFLDTAAMHVHAETDGTDEAETGHDQEATNETRAERGRTAIAAYREVCY